MSVLTEKDPTFIQDTRIEGNLSVVEHPNDASYYGDGSVEIGGTLSVDTLKSATPGSFMIVKSPFQYKILVNKPSAPVPGFTQLYADGDFDGRLVMSDSNNKVIDLNPLTSVGDMMTFDGLKNTTARLPVGLPDQILSCDPSRNFASRLAWKDQYANTQNVDDITDGYMRYVEASNANSISLSNTPQVLVTESSSRCDSDAFSVASGGAGGIIILQAGIYEINVKINVSFDPELVKGTTLTNGNVIPIETYLDAGFVVVPGSHNYHTLTFLENSQTYSSQSISTRIFLHLSTNNTRVRIFAMETEDSTTGVLKIKPFETIFSITKFDSRDDIVEILMTQGLQGSRPNMSSEFSSVPIDSVVYQTNTNDLIQDDSVTVSNGGLRHLSAKFAFEKFNVNTNLEAVMECRILINGQLIINGTSKTSLVGSIGNTTCYINTIVNTNANDIITMEARILSSNLSSGSILVISEQSCLTVALPTISQWKPLTVHSDSIHNAYTSAFNPIEFNITDYIDDEYQVKGHDIIMTTGGTYLYLLSADFQNLESLPFSFVSRLQVDTGSGWRVVPGSAIVGTLPPQSIYTHHHGASIFVPPFSKIRYEILAPDGGNIQILDDTAQFMLHKYEYTRTSFTGLLDFGRFSTYASDDDEVLSTSTVFSSRLMTSTYNIPRGKYRFGFSFEWDMNAAGIGFETRVTLDNNTVVDSYRNVPLVSGSYSKVSSFQQIQLENGEHSFSFDVKVDDSTRALKTRNVHLELWKI